jgi:hypothetical protein
VTVTKDCGVVVGLGAYYEGADGLDAGVVSDFSALPVDAFASGYFAASSDFFCASSGFFCASSGFFGASSGFFFLGKSSFNEC